MATVTFDNLVLLWGNDSTNLFIIPCTFSGPVTPAMLIEADAKGRELACRKFGCEIADVDFVAWVSQIYMAYQTDSIFIQGGKQ